MEGFIKEGLCEQVKNSAGTNFQPGNTAHCVTGDLAKILWLIKDWRRFLLRCRPDSVTIDLVWWNHIHLRLLVFGNWNAVWGHCFPWAGLTPKEAADPGQDGSHELLPVLVLQTAAACTQPVSTRALCTAESFRSYTGTKRCPSTMPWSSELICS